MEELNSRNNYILTRHRFDTVILFYRLKLSIKC